MKGVSYVVASILMLVITIALSGTAYMFISGVFTTTIQGIEIADAYCSLGEVTLSIKNIGSTAIGALEIEQTNPKIDDILERAFQGAIEPGKSVTYTDTCEGEESRRCIYRITPPVGKTITADVICTGRSPSLVAAWHFDEGSGTEVKDSSGNDNDGTFKNITGFCGGTACPTWVEGKYGYALEFDGIGDYIEIPYDPSLFPGTSSWTITGWIKTQGDSMSLIGSNYSTTVSNPQSYWGVWIEDGVDTNKIYIEFSDTLNHAFGVFDPGATIINDGTWHHVAIIRDKSINKFTLYVDGVHDGTDIIDTTDNIVRNDLIYIGVYVDPSPDENYAQLNGTIDEIKIYNKALI